MSRWNWSAYIQLWHVCLMGRWPNHYNPWRVRSSCRYHASDGTWYNCNQNRRFRKQFSFLDLPSCNLHFARWSSLVCTRHMQSCYFYWSCDRQLRHRNPSLLQWEWIRRNINIHNWYYLDSGSGILLPWMQDQWCDPNYEIIKSILDVNKRRLWCPCRNNSSLATEPLVQEVWYRFTCGDSWYIYV